MPKKPMRWYNLLLHSNHAAKYENLTVSITQHKMSEFISIPLLYEHYYLEYLNNTSVPSIHEAVRFSLIQVYNCLNRMSNKTGDYLS